MKLYHGTSLEAAENALVVGLVPRGKRKGNWGRTVMSRSDAVYLTNCYAPYFAMCADDKTPALLEIDTDHLTIGNLVPDEDVLEQGFRGRDDLPSDWSMEKRTKHYRKYLHNWAGEYEMSIKAMGNCAYLGTIPPEAITRALYFDPREAQQFSWQSMDPSISLMNYKLVGKKYRGLTKWAFGDDLGDDAPIVQPGLVIDGRPWADYFLPLEEERKSFHWLRE